MESEGRGVFQKHIKCATEIIGWHLEERPLLLKATHLKIIVIMCLGEIVHGE